jgi:anti-sigma B factor antagonist
MDDIKISLEAPGGGHSPAVVRVDGVVDTMTAGELENVMNSLIEQKRFNIIVDLGGVDYISSAGWGIFISNIREIRQNRGDIKLAQMMPSVYEIYELLEFDSILNAFDSVEKARLDFRGGQEAQPSGEAIAVLRAPIEQPPVLGKAPVAGLVPSSAGRPWTLEAALEQICRHDPFLSTAEIRRALAEAPYSLQVGWWTLWRKLRTMDLGTKRQRFALSRRQKS